VRTWGTVMTDTNGRNIELGFCPHNKRRRWGEGGGDAIRLSASNQVKSALADLQGGSGGDVWKCNIM
jgi:hypothetical protein